MGFGVLFGSACGVAMSCIANHARHISIVKNPWEHATFAILFGVAGYYHDKYLPIMIKTNVEREQKEGNFNERTPIPFVRALYLEQEAGPADPVPATRGNPI